MAGMGASAAPAIFYQDEAAGQLQQQLGAPSPELLTQILGRALSSGRRARQG